MNIFVSICSYQDPLLPHTIKSMLQTASGRNNIVYSIFEQTRYEDSLECREPTITSHPYVIYKRIDPEYSDGCVWARYINLLNVNAEYDFIYQIDSHIIHDQNWDRSLIEDYKRARDIADTNKVIITGSCKSFRIEEVGDEIITYYNELPGEEYSCKVKYHTIDPETLIPVAHGEKRPATDMPQPASHIMAGNFFTHVDWVDNVGLDPKIFFEGEEIMMSVMSYAAGYKMFHHSKMVSYHLEDTTGWHTKRDPLNPVANHRRSILKETGRWRWKHFVETCREDLLESFREEFGIDFINLHIEDRAKTFDLEISQNLSDPLAIKKAAEDKKNQKKHLPAPLFMKVDE